MSTSIRIGAGNIPAYTFLNTSSYLVTNWTRQTDMRPGVDWLVTQPDQPMLQQYRPSLEIGAGRFVGRFATSLTFWFLTEDMRQYIDTNIMSNKPTAQVTAYVEHPINGFGVYVGELITPYAANTGTFRRFDQNIYTENTYLFARATLKTIDYLLQENGDYLLQENGDRIVLEQQS